MHLCAGSPVIGGRGDADHLRWQPLVSWKPDDVNHLPDGSREEIKWRPRLGVTGERSRMWKIIDANGTSRELWHEVVDVTGVVTHRHLKWAREVP